MDGAESAGDLLERIVNTCLRGLTLASRFLLLFLLARLLDLADLGLFGLLAATIGYALVLVGFDFYIYTADRFWFESLVSIEVPAAYVLAIGIAGILGSFLEALIFVYQYPVLIRFWQEKSPAAFCWESLRMSTQTMHITDIFSFLAIFCLPLLVSWLDRPTYAQYQQLFPYLMFAAVLYSLSKVSHYMLYAQGLDGAITCSHVVALSCFVLAVWILPGWNSLLAVPVALCVSFAVLLVWKFAAYLLLTPLPYRIFMSANRQAYV